MALSITFLVEKNILNKMKKIYFSKINDRKNN